jgi:predicted DNA-binding transcriptional regulator AlpA
MTARHEQDRRLRTPAETAEQLRVSARTLADWRYRGVGPKHIRISRRTVAYRQGDIDAWLDARVRTSTSDTGEAA